MSSPPPRASWLTPARPDASMVLAGERPGPGYDRERRRSLAGQAADRLARLDRAIGEVAEMPVPALTEDEVRAELAAIQDAIRRLDARACRLTSALTSRAASDARAAADGDARAGERAARQVRSELARDLRLSPTQVKRAQQIGDRVDASSVVGDALDAGTITPDHVRSMDRCLDHLTGDDRDHAEAKLLDVATHGTALDVTDAGTRLLAALDPTSAAEAAERRHARRVGKLTRTRDGMLRVSAELTGLDAEEVATAFHAWRRPDRPDERRTPDQRGADALIAMARASIAGRSDITPPGDANVEDRPGRAPTPPTNHGVRPHIVVTVDLPTLLAGTGIAQTEWTGPIVWDHIKHLLDDCGLTFVALRDELPVAVTTEVRSVPVGLWKAVQLRDQGCIRDGCDLPAAWCQVAHLADWYSAGGKLTLDTSGLLCTADHRDFDAGRLAVTWTDGRPTVHPPGDPP